VRSALTPSRPLGETRQNARHERAKMNPWLQVCAGLANGLGLSPGGRRSKTKGPDVIYWFWAVVVRPPHLEAKLPPSWLDLRSEAPAH